MDTSKNNLAWYELWTRGMVMKTWPWSWVTQLDFFNLNPFIAISSLSSLPDRDSRTVVTLLEGQVVTLTAVSYNPENIMDNVMNSGTWPKFDFFPPQKTDELQAALLQEREARVQLESQLQQFTDRLSPLMISPAPWSITLVNTHWPIWTFWTHFIISTYVGDWDFLKDIFVYIYPHFPFSFVNQSHFFQHS